MQSQTGHTCPGKYHLVSRTIWWVYQIPMDRMNVIIRRNTAESTYRNLTRIKNKLHNVKLMSVFRAGEK